MKTTGFSIKSILVICALSLSSCEGFFDLAPKDGLNDKLFWNNADDAYSALTACYNWWCANDNGSKTIFYEEAYSDIAYNFTNTSNVNDVAKGSLSPVAAPNKWKQYETIRRCNYVISNIDRVPADQITEEQKNDILGQARAIRGYSHALITNWYGDAVKMNFVPDTDEDAKLPRVPAEEIRAFALEDLEWAASGKISTDNYNIPGRITTGSVLAMLVRFNLYWGNYDKVIEYAERLRNFDEHQYELEKDFLKMFSMEGQDSKEIIVSYQHIQTIAKYGDAIRFFNNADGGWASFVPTTYLVEMFEMKDGKLITDSDSGYDPEHPFANRDPRLAQTIIYSGMEWEKPLEGGDRIFNMLDREINGSANKDYYLNATNSSHTGMLFAKYAWPGPAQYIAGMRDDSVCPIIFRYAEVLLSLAEAYVESETNRDLSKALDIIDEIRTTRGHIKVDRSRYSTQNEVRELVRRERTIELAGEGFRYEDIIRWDEYDASGNKTGKKVAETALTRNVYRYCGTVNMDPSVDRDMRAEINPNASEADRLVEVRPTTFDKKRLLFPLLQSELETNPALVQNPGY